MLGWLFGFLWLAVLKAWLGSHVALDADALGVADLWRSLGSGGHLGDWSMGPHPYVFPDLPLYGFAGLFSPDLAGRQSVYGLMLGFLVWWFLARLMKGLWNLDGSTARAYAGAGLLLALPCCTAANALGAVFTPGFHGGALLCGLAFLAWVVRQDRRLSSWFSVAWTAGLVGLTWASDQIVPSFALLPALALSLGLSGPARRRIFGAVGLAWAVRASVLACWAGDGMQVARFRWGYSFEHAGFLADSFVSMLVPVLVSLGPALVLALLTVGLLGVQARVRERPLFGWFAVALVLAALAALFLSAIQGTLQGRYFVGLAWLGVPLLPLALSDYLGGGPLPLAGAALIGLLCLGSAPAPGPLDVVAQARWLDAQLGPRGLKQGWADYWNARPLRLLSQEGLVLAPMAQEGKSLKNYVWIVDRTVFDHGNRVQFVVLNGLDPAAVRGALGAPVEQLNGAGLTLWIYAVPLESRRA